MPIGRSDESADSSLQFAQVSALQKDSAQSALYAIGATREQIVWNIVILSELYLKYLIDHRRYKKLLKCSGGTELD